MVNDLKTTVTIFGSARTKENYKYYKKARELSKKLAAEGFTPVTGGGGGIMEAGNRGAFESGGESVGFNIVLPNEQTLNAYTTRNLSIGHFFSRKVLLTFNAEAYVCFPGGFGTLDELFEILTLIQTKKMPMAPVILIGESFWKPLDKFIKNQLLMNGMIDSGDEHLYKVTDSLDYAVEKIKTYCKTCHI